MIKTKEFIKRVEQLGYLVNEGYADWQISRISKGQDLLVAIVNKNNLCRISTDFVGWWDIPDEDKSKLLDLIVEFASTPIEDREEEKKYRIISKLIPDSNFKYLCKRCGSIDELEFDVEHNIDSKFTQKEIEEIKEKFNTNLEDFELVEVEEWKFTWLLK